MKANSITKGAAAMSTTFKFTIEQLTVTIVVNLLKARLTKPINVVFTRSTTVVTIATNVVNFEHYFDQEVKGYNF